MPNLRGASPVGHEVGGRLYVAWPVSSGRPKMWEWRIRGVWVWKVTVGVRGEEGGVRRVERTREDVGEVSRCSGGWVVGEAVIGKRDGW